MHAPYRCDTNLVLVVLICESLLDRNWIGVTTTANSRNQVAIIWCFVGPACSGAPHLSGAPSLFDSSARAPRTGAACAPPSTSGASPRPATLRPWRSSPTRHDPPRVRAPGVLRDAAASVRSGSRWTPRRRRLSIRFNIQEYHHQQNRHSVCHVARAPF